MRNSKRELFRLNTKSIDIMVQNSRFRFHHLHRWLLALFLFLLFQAVYAQSKRIDSLMVLLSNCKTDTFRVQLLCQLGGEYFYKLSDASKGLATVNEALHLAEKINFKNGIANTYLLLAIINFEKGNYQESEYFNMKAYDLFTELQNRINIGALELNLARIKLFQSKFEEALTHAVAGEKIYQEFNLLKDVANAENLAGLIYTDWGNYTEALIVFAEALDKFIKVQDSVQMADVWVNMANIYIEQGNRSKAIENDIAALKIYELKNDKLSLARIYSIIGDAYKLENNRTEAMNYYNKSMEIAKSTQAKEIASIVLERIGSLEKGSKNYLGALEYYQQSLVLNKEMGRKLGISSNLENIGEVNFLLGNSNEAIKYYEESLDISREIGDQLGVVSICNHLGKLNLAISQPDSAKKYFLQALPLAKEMKAFDYLRDAEQGLYEISLREPNYQEALNHYKIYTEYKDSIFDSEKSKQLYEVKGKYESELKDRQLKLQSLELFDQKRSRNYLIGFIILFAIISFLIYREYFNRQRIKLQALRNRIASDLHDDVGSTLSSISIFSQIAQRKPGEVQSLLQTIEDSSKKMLDAMADIVWTIKPENDQFEKIILRMRSFAYELLGAKQIEFRFVVDDKVGKIIIPMDARRNLYLIFKEATNNMVKYSNATKAEFAITEQPGKLIMNIQDDGIGFDSQLEHQGNGLKNMYARAKEIGASLSINSTSGSGTQINLVMEV